jgi:hypothetical protein
VAVLSHQLAYTELHAIQRKTQLCAYYVPFCDTPILYEFMQVGEEEYKRQARIVRDHGAAVVVMAFDEEGQVCNG